MTVAAGSVVAKRPAETAIGAWATRFSPADVTQGVTVAAVNPLSITPKGTLAPLSLMATIARVLVTGSLYLLSDLYNPYHGSCA